MCYRVWGNEGIFRHMFQPTTLSPVTPKMLAFLMIPLFLSNCTVELAMTAKELNKSPTPKSRNQESIYGSISRIHGVFEFDLDPANHDYRQTEEFDYTERQRWVLTVSNLSTPDHPYRTSQPTSEKAKQILFLLFWNNYENIKYCLSVLKLLCFWIF